MHTFVALLRALVVGAVPRLWQNDKLKSLKMLAERRARVQAAVDRSPGVCLAPQCKYLQYMFVATEQHAAHQM